MQVINKQNKIWMYKQNFKINIIYNNQARHTNIDVASCSYQINIFDTSHSETENNNGDKKWQSLTYYCTG